MSNFKSRHRSLFCAMQADAKSFEGGIQNFASFIGRNGNTVGNQFNPEHDAAPPSLEMVAELIKLTGGDRTVFALCQMAGKVPMDFEVEHHAPSESIRLFLSLVHSASELMGKGSEAAKDLHFDAGERKELEPLLLALMKATAEVLQSVRG